MEKGQVLFGINNIYTVAVGNNLMQCRIKGKVFKQEENYYNPIAVGDIVEITPDPLSKDVGWITGREDRTSYFLRWNKKRRGVQVIAANTDKVVCVTSVKSPPFRPRFLDRMLVSGEVGKMKILILVNKCDLGIDPEVQDRLLDFQRIGYKVVFCSALTGQGIEELKAEIKDTLSVFVGQSGVGKSSILNHLDPKLKFKVGTISSKYDRGIHTTSYSTLVTLKDDIRVIDTPGIRELDLVDIKHNELQFYFPEIAPLSPQCSYTCCLHIDEPECAVRKALEDAKIHPDRYVSYLRMLDYIKEFEKENYG